MRLWAGALGFSFRLVHDRYEDSYCSVWTAYVFIGPGRKGLRWYYHCLDLVVMLG